MPRLIDIPRIVRQRNSRRRTPRSARAVELPAVLDKDLFAVYMRVVRAWQEIARERIIPSYEGNLAMAKPPTHDAYRDDLNGLGEELNSADGGMQRLIVSLTPDIRRWTVRTENAHRAKFTSAMKVATSVDLGTLLSQDGVETTLGAVLQRNVSLVRAVSDDIREKIGDAVFRNFTARNPVRDLARDINEATGLARDRSLRIASDQTVKLASALDRERQQEVGIDQFEWQHSGKLHYRPEHKARDGKVYSWDDNNLDGDLPGVAINCGCKAKAFIGPAEE